MKQILLQEEQVVKQKLENDVNVLKTTILDDENLSETLKPHLDQHFEEKVVYMKENFPTLFGKYLGTAIKVQIREAQDEIIDALYPIIGKLISRYLRAEFERISQQIDDRLRNPFSFENLKVRLKAFFSGVSYQEYLVRQSAALAEIEEVFVLDKVSGILLGHHSAGELSHPDMVGGMLKGIQDFVEHAFEQEGQELDMIEYDRYKILIYHFQSFTIAVVVDGQPNAIYKQRLRDHTLKFIEEYTITAGTTVSREQQNELSNALNSHFYGFNQVAK